MVLLCFPLQVISVKRMALWLLKKSSQKLVTMRPERKTRIRTGSAYDPIVALLVKNGVVTLDAPEKGRRIANYAKEQGLKVKLEIKPEVKITLL
jgi:hypothetical protein